MEVLRTAILEMCRQKKNNTFCPSEVVKRMFPEDWDLFLEEVRSVVLEMNQEGLIQIMQNGKTIDPDSVPVNPIRIRMIPNQRKS